MCQIIFKSKGKFLELKPLFGVTVFIHNSIVIKECRKINYILFFECLFVDFLAMSSIRWNSPLTYGIKSPLVTNMDLFIKLGLKL